MFATLFRSATSKGLVAGLAAVVATAGIGVAVAAPTEAPEEPAALAIGTSGGIDDDAVSAVNPQVDVLVPTTVIDDAEVDESEGDSTSAPPVATNFSRSAASPPVIPPANADRFLAEGDLFNRDLLKGLLPDEATSDDVAEGAEALAQEVIARIEECVEGVAGDFGSDFDFDGSNGASGRGFGADGSAGFDESFATSIVDDVLPCVSGLVDDALDCVSGLVEEILATVMSMDFEEIAGMAGIIVDELVNCVGDVEADQAS